MLAVDSLGTKYTGSSIPSILSHTRHGEPSMITRPLVITRWGTLLPGCICPKTKSGRSPKVVLDSFMYREQNGVKSILLDDNNCYCLSSMSMGCGMCRTSGPSNGNVPGVDALYDSGCNAPRPVIGLTLYFRVTWTKSSKSISLRS